MRNLSIGLVLDLPRMGHVNWSATWMTFVLQSPTTQRLGNAGSHQARPLRTQIHVQSAPFRTNNAEQASISFYQENSKSDTRRDIACNKKQTFIFKSYKRRHI